MGPVANRQQYEKVLGYLSTARAEGATVVCGGTADDDRGGYFVKPTVLSVKPTDTVYSKKYTIRSCSAGEAMTRVTRSVRCAALSVR